MEANSLGLFITDTSRYDSSAVFFQPFPDIWIKFRCQMQIPLRAIQCLMPQIGRQDRKKLLDIAAGVHGILQAMDRKCVANVMKVGSFSPSAVGNAAFP